MSEVPQSCCGRCDCLKVDGDHEFLHLRSPFKSSVKWEFVPGPILCSTRKAIYGRAIWMAKDLPIK